MNNNVLANRNLLYIIMKNLHDVADWSNLAQTSKKINQNVKYVLKTYKFPINHKYDYFNVRYIPVERLANCKTNKANYIILYAKIGDINSIKYMFKHAKLDEKSLANETVCAAAEFGQLKTLKYLIKYFKELGISIRIEYGDYYMHYIAGACNHVDILSYLFDVYMLPPNEVNTEIYTDAILRSNFDVIELLNKKLQGNIDVTYNDCMAICAAVRKNNITAVKYLMKTNKLQQLTAKNHFAIKHAKKYSKKHGYTEIYEYLLTQFESSDLN